MTRPVMVLTEQKEASLPDHLSVQLLARGRAIADQLGVKLIRLILGSGLAAPAGSGEDVTVVADDPALLEYSAERYGEVVSDAVRDVDPAVFLLGYTYLGMELAPVVATTLEASLATNCVDLALVRGEFQATRSVVGGLFRSRIVMRGRGPFIVSMQPCVTVDAGRDHRGSQIVPLPVKLSDHFPRVRVLQELVPAPGNVDIAKADVVVAMGRGMGDKENVRIANDLADGLGGVIACSRPLADMGWLPEDRLVGISGKTINPKVYIACGISGSMQHLAGMRGARLIIAINKDPQAPIFKVAHYGFVGDLLEVLPAMTRAARQK